MLKQNSFILSVVIVCILFLLVITLTGCGGGGDEKDYDDTVQLNPPDCKNHPEICK